MSFVSSGDDAESKVLARPHTQKSRNKKIKDPRRSRAARIAHLRPRQMKDERTEQQTRRTIFCQEPRLVIRRPKQRLLVLNRLTST